MSTSDDIQVARKAARAAAEVIASNFDRPAEVRLKAGSQTMVTDTDLAAEAAILDVLRKHSGYGILSEESGAAGNENGPVWIVDPLDGTSNFARALPLFAVSVALVNGSNLLAGVVIDPIHTKEFYASNGSGAFCNGMPLIHRKHHHSSPVLFLNHGHRKKDKIRFAGLTQRLSSDYGLRKLGTTALELCYVAEGYFDGFICSGDEIWDYAAGALIAREAGCVFSCWQGEPWDGKNDFILVARPEIHGALVEKIRDLS